MRICLISSGHKPDDDRIFYKEGRSLTKICDDLWIISPFSSNIPEEKDGVRFLSVSTRSRSLRDRFHTMRELFDAAINLRADIYHCHEPESLLVALRLKKILGCKIIFDSHEMYSATLAQRFPKSMHRQIMFLYKCFERSKLVRCDYLIGATWSISQYLQIIGGSKKTETILNGAVSDVLGAMHERKWGNTTILCHDGALTFSRGLANMVKAIDMVRKKHSVKFRIVGDVFGQEKKWLDSYIKLHRLEGVIERTGWLNYSDIGPAISECHIGLLALEKIPNHIVAAPNKIFNYMHFGIPFIAPNHCRDIRKLINDHNCGMSVDNTSVMSYARAISHLIEHRDETLKMGVSAKKASDTKYNWSQMEQKLLCIYKTLAAC